MSEIAHVQEPQLQQCIDLFSAAQPTASQICGDLSEEQFNWRAHPGEWSVGQCIDHLTKLGNIVLPHLAQAVDEGRAHGPFGKGPFTYNLFSRFFVKAVGPRKNLAKGRTKAPAIYVPDKAHEPVATLDAFISLQRELIACAQKADGLHLKRIKVASPVTRLIRVSLGAWFEALALHQLRHFEQANDVRAKMGL